jgi:hypothetical protein
MGKFLNRARVEFYMLFLSAVAMFVDKFFPQALGMGVDTTVTTLTEAIPTIKASALLELEEGDVVRPLVTYVPFPGAGVVHDTPFIQKLTSEADDSLAGQGLDSGTNDETSPSQATVGVHGAYVQLKELAQLASVDDMAAVAGQLIGQCIVTRRDKDLIALFTSLTNQGGAATNIAPADLYDAYGTLRTYFAPLPYHLVLHPLQIWSSVGLISLFDNSADAIQTQGPGTVGEEFARYGFAGMALGFNLWADANITLTNNNGSGAAFSSGAIKFVHKRGFRIDIQADAAEVATKIVGTEIWGEALLRAKHGNEMQFDTV